MTCPAGYRGDPANQVLAAALAYARRGWPVLPCHADRKTPATPHGSRDASTDTGQITAWFAGHPDRNLAIATGTPGPDVLDIDRHPGGTGYPALRRLAAAGLTAGASAWVRTPSGGVHAYFTGSGQRNGHLPRHHLDFRSAGGYVLAPPSAVGGRRYQVIKLTAGRWGLDWAQVTGLLEPARQPPGVPRAGRPPAGIGQLAAWVAALPEGNRNAGLYWAANRALDTDPAADLGQLAAAARQAGLAGPEIRATLASAGRASRRHQPGRDGQAEAAR